jgi:predicted metalloprotease
VTFDPNARLDPTEVTDARGGGGGGFGGRGGMVVGGGGIGTLILLVAYLLLGGDPGSILGGGGSGAAPDTNGPNSSALASCQTGADANKREDCQIVGYVNSIQKFWGTQIQNYEKAETVIFTGATNTGCGSASSSTGPFYCPVDKNVYLDLGFFQELQDRFGAKDAPFARAYVVAHEYGHHVQDLLGDLQPGGNDTGAEGRSVRTELQADCYAGVWARNAAAVSNGAVTVEAGDLEKGLQTANAIGDDTLQRRSQGRVVPEAFTHGSSAQRVEWLQRGYQSGDPDSCDTFSAL